MTTFEHDAFFDLVHHTLAHLMVCQADASRLHSPSYVQWCAARLPVEPELETDYAQLGALYDACPEAHRLNAFFALYDSLEAFEQSVTQDFAPDALPAAKQPLGRRLAAALSHPLLELFRIAVWTEKERGYLRLRDETLLPLYEAAIAALDGPIDGLALYFPFLRNARLRLCHPLGRHGRLLSGRQVAIGVPGAPFDTDALDCLLQACHELTLRQVLEHAPMPQTAQTKAGSPGYREHAGRESVAVCLWARALVGSNYAERACARLAALWPGQSPDEIAKGAPLRGAWRELYDALAESRDAT